MVMSHRRIHPIPNQTLSNGTHRSHERHELFLDSYDPPPRIESQGSDTADDDNHSVFGDGIEARRLPDGDYQLFFDPGLLSQYRR